MSRMRTRYAIHIRTNGTYRIVHAYTEQGRENVEQAIDRDPDSIRLHTIPEQVVSDYSKPPIEKAHPLVGILFISFILVALLYGLGVF